MLPANGNHNLPHQAASANLHDATNKLIATADPPETGSQLRAGLALGPVQQTVHFALWDAMMPSRRLYGPQLVLVHPLFQRWITDSQQVCRISWLKENFRHIAVIRRLELISQYDLIRLPLTAQRVRLLFQCFFVKFCKTLALGGEETIFLATGYMSRNRIK